MKKQKKTIRFLASSIVLLLLLAGYVTWFYIFPYSVSYSVLQKFEDACYARDVDKMLSTIDNHSKYHHGLVERGPEPIFDTFQKFQKGFKIRGVQHEFDIIPDDKENKRKSEVITVFLTKVAKIDNEDRPFFNIAIAKIDGEWKIEYYFFPDYIDY